MDIRHGIRINLTQFTLQLLQVFFVGATIGMTRTVLPVLAESDFGLAKGSFLALTSFVVVFGLVKALLNLFAGRLSDRWGRRPVLIAGWLAALPVPFLILYAPGWGWIVAATVLLGINQGLCWSMALNSKLDLARAEQRGLVNGLNEFSGYAGVALAGLFTAALADLYGAREGLFWFGTLTVVVALALGLWGVRETRPWALAHQKGTASAPMPLLQLFWPATWHDVRLRALHQAGLVEKFTDAIVWLFFPVFFVAQGASLVEAGGLVAVYGLVWGAGQLVTGPLSDRIGRKKLIVWGMWLCGAGVIAVGLSASPLLWALEAAIIGAGMAMLYPTLGAAVADHAEPSRRASILGIYRFWRDLGYAIGGLALGLAAQWSGGLGAPFWLVGAAMLLSGAYVALRLDAPRAG
ncbi:MFS transporter [uncultured Zoogloea sp.]|uniref:MFS transporter n=1 Tax=uncultured Zoogloea sp. TaxID=160237 RepID=UPI002626178B|nr:MFS transporter [uncultured Zoogloea sp.]